MTHPQQPEVDRSGLGATDQRSAELKAAQGPRAPQDENEMPDAPDANVSTDARKSGAKSTTRDALESD